MSIDFLAFDKAVYGFYGGMSGILTQECGCQIVKGYPGGTTISLYEPRHGDTRKNLSGTYLHCNDTRDFWWCYKCENEGGHMYHRGHAIEALVEFKGMSRGEAFKYLCEKVGFQSNQEYSYSYQDIRRMYVATCHELLLKHQKKEPYSDAMQYLQGRGFNIETIKKHRIGFCTGFEAVKILRKKGITDQQMAGAGILKPTKKDPSKFYPAFWGRVTMMAGEYNMYGRTIDPECSLRHYYTSDKNAIFNEMVLCKEWDAIVVVEAAFDALAIEQLIHATGENWTVIATCGTGGIKLEDLIPRIKEVCPAEVILVPDADMWRKDGKRHAPGQNAGLNKARAFEAAGLRTRIVVLPNGSDPNDLAKNGIAPGEFRKMVDCALTPVKFAIYCEAHYHRYRTTEGAISLLNAVRKMLFKYKVHLTKEVIDYLVLLTQVDRQEIKKLFAPILKEADAVDYIRSMAAQGKNIDEILLDLKQKALGDLARTA